MATKPNVLCFNEYISDHLKNENDKRGKTPRTAEFAIFGAPPKKIGNLRGGGRGGPLRACVHTLLLRHEHKFRDAWYRCTAMGKGD